MVIDMKNFKAFISEAEAVPERQMDSSKPSNPQSNLFKQDPEGLEGVSSGLGKKKIGSRTSRTRTSALRPEYFDDDGNSNQSSKKIYERRAGKRI